MDRARSFATIGRALYMAHGCSQVPDSRKSAETLSRPIGARTARALQMDFTVSTNGGNKERAQADRSTYRGRAAVLQSVVYILIRNSPSPLFGEDAATDARSPQSRGVAVSTERKDVANRCDSRRGTSTRSILYDLLPAPISFYVILECYLLEKKDTSILTSS